MLLLIMMFILGWESLSLGRLLGSSELQQLLLLLLSHTDAALQAEHNVHRGQPCALMLIGVALGEASDQTGETAQQQ